MNKYLVQIALLGTSFIAGCIIPPGSVYQNNGNGVAHACPSHINSFDCGFYQNGYRSGEDDARRGMRNNNDRSSPSYISGYEDAQRNYRGNGAGGQQDYNRNNNQNNGDVYSPSQGVICDRRGNFCADSYGISISYTKEYLGAEAEAQLMQQVNSVGSDNWDGSQFGLSNGVSCDSKARRCTGKNADGYTKLLFGN